MYAKPLTELALVTEDLTRGELRWLATNVQFGSDAEDAAREFGWWQGHLERLREALGKAISAASGNGAI